MDQNIKELLEAQQKKIDEIYSTMEKIKKYIKWSLIISLVFFVLPLVAAIIIVPIVLQGYLSAIGNLGI